MPDPAVTKLRTAAAGLTFVSEGDAPFEAFEWAADGELTPAAIRRLGGHAKNAPVAEVPLEPFFAPLIAEQDWHGDEEKEQRPQVPRPVGRAAVGVDRPEDLPRRQGHRHVLRRRPLEKGPVGWREDPGHADLMASTRGEPGA